MKYVLLIHQGAGAVPGNDAWEKLSEDEQKQVYADYQALNETPGVTPNDMRLDSPETATTVRVQDGQDADHRRTVRVRQGGARWLAHLRGGRPRRRDRARLRIPAARLGGGIEIRPVVRGVIAILEQVFRDEWGRVLASLIGFLGSFELAEEAAQEAFAIAAERWPREGTPDNPRAWLVTTARNRAIDRIRRDRTLAEKTRLLDVPGAH